MLELYHSRLCSCNSTRKENLNTSFVLQKKKKDRDATQINRKVFTDNNAYDISNIPIDFKVASIWFLPISYEKIGVENLICWLFLSIHCKVKSCNCSCVSLCICLYRRCSVQLFLPVLVSFHLRFCKFRLFYTSSKRKLSKFHATPC